MHGRGGFRFMSPQNARGVARFRLLGVPARDLGEADVARLAPEQYEQVCLATLPDGSPLYVACGIDQTQRENDDAVEAPDGPDAAVEPVEDGDLLFGADIASLDSGAESAGE